MCYPKIYLRISQTRVNWPMTGEGRFPQWRSRYALVVAAGNWKRVSRGCGKHSLLCALELPCTSRDVLSDSLSVLFFVLIRRFRASSPARMRSRITGFPNRRSNLRTKTTWPKSHGGAERVPIITVLLIYRGGNNSPGDGFVRSNWGAKLLDLFCRRPRAVEIHLHAVRRLNPSGTVKRHSVANKIGARQRCLPDNRPFDTSLHGISSLGSTQ